MPVLRRPLTPVLAELENAYPDDLRIVFRHFPLDSIHDKALLGARAAEAAGEQGAFWEMHDLLFNRYEEWTSMETGEFTIWLSEVAVPELGLDNAQFEGGHNQHGNRHEGRAGLARRTGDRACREPRSWRSIMPLSRPNRLL